jgi:hypothetical protein
LAQTRDIMTLRPRVKLRQVGSRAKPLRRRLATGLLLALSAMFATGACLAAERGAGGAQIFTPIVAHESPQGDEAAELKPRDLGYVWSATRSGSSLRLRGMVPSEEDRGTVLGVVKANFPDLEVEDRLRVVDGALPKEQWLGAVSFGLKQLTLLKHGSVRLLNVGLRIDGEARGAAEYAEVKKSLSGPLPTGLSIIGDNVRPPMADPFVFVASLGPDSLALIGSVPSDRSRKQLRDLSRQLFERSSLDDRLELASGAPKDWDTAVMAALKALSRLESGKISLSGLVLTVEGVAPDKGTAAAVSDQLRLDLPALFSSSESISWKNADAVGNGVEWILELIKANRPAGSLLPKAGAGSLGQSPMRGSE